MKIKEIVAGNTAWFSHYQKGYLNYKIYLNADCTKVFEFPVPIEDCGDGVFKEQDKAIFFMRWIRKHLENIEAGKEETKIDE